MRKNILMALVFVMAFLLLFAGCGAGSEDTFNDIKAAGKFVVGLDDEFAPMGFRDENNEIVGFDVDLAKEAARRLGLEVEFQPISWDAKEMELKNKNIDVIWNGLSITEERKKQMAFTKPYLENLQVIVVPEGSDIKTKADLAGKKVGVQAGSTSKDALEADTETFESIGELVEYPTNFEALLDLGTGRIDAVVVDEILGRYYIAMNDAKLVVLEDNFGREEYGVGLRLGDKEFLEALNKVLDEMKADGTAAEISRKWFGEDIVK